MPKRDTQGYICRRFRFCTQASTKYLQWLLYNHLYGKYRKKTRERSSYLVTFLFYRVYLALHDNIREKAFCGFLRGKRESDCNRLYHYYYTRIDYFW